MADLKTRIERLVGRLVGGRGGEAAGPAGGSRPEQLRPGDAGFAAAVARLVAMPLDHFTRKGAPLEVRVPWLSETVWFVADERQAEALGRESVSRGRVRTAVEVMVGMAAEKRARETLRTLMVTKFTFGGDVVGLHIAKHHRPNEGRPASGHKSLTFCAKSPRGGIEWATALLAARLQLGGRR